MGDSDREGLPFPAVRHASGNKSQFVQTADIVVVIAEQGEHRINSRVSPEDQESWLYAPGLHKPSKRYFHLSLDGSCRLVLPEFN